MAVNFDDYGDFWSDDGGNAGVGGGGSTNLSDYAKKVDVPSLDNVKSMGSIPTASDFTNDDDIIRVNDTLYLKDNSDNVIEIGTGRGKFLGAYDSIGDFPDDAKNGEYAFLNKQDGSNMRGLYVYSNGWRFVSRYFDLDDHLIAISDDSYQNYGSDRGYKRYAISYFGELMRAKVSNFTGSEGTGFIGAYWKYAITERVEDYFSAIGKVKQNVQLQKGAGNLELNLIGGTVFDYVGDPNEVNSYTINDTTPITFDVIYTGGTVATDVTEVNFRNWDNGGTLETLSGNDCGYSEFYLNYKTGKIYQVLGQRLYTSKYVGIQRFVTEQKTLPAEITDDFIFIGGLLIENDDTTINEEYIIPSTKFCEIAKGGGAGASILYKEPVADLTALKNVQSPINGEMRLLEDKLPSIELWVFDINATSGEEANDGTTGYWNKLEGGGKLFKQHPIAPANGSTLEAESYYSIDTMSSSLTYNLPSASDNAWKFICVEKATNDQNEVTIMGVNDMAGLGYKLKKQYEKVTVFSDGGQWYKLSSANDHTFYRTITDSYQVQHDDDILLVDSSGGDILINLSSQLFNKPIIIKHIAGDNAVNVFTDDGHGGTGTVEGMASKEIPLNTSFVIFKSTIDTAYIVAAYSEEKDEQPRNPLIGTFTYVARQNKTDEELEKEGYFPLKGGTYTNYRIKYPIASEKLPASWISGDDWNIPTEVEGIFLRNLGGNADNEAVFQDMDIQPHTHTYVRPSNGKRFGGGSTYGDYATYYPATKTSGSTGGVETRPVNMAFQLCIIVDSINKLYTIPDDVKLAEKVTVTYGYTTSLGALDLTVNGGYNEVVAMKGVGFYRVMIDLPTDKMIYPSYTDDYTTVVDAFEGHVTLQVGDDYAGDTLHINLPLQDVPNEKLLNKQYLITDEREIPAYDEILFETDNLTKQKGSDIEVDVKLFLRDNTSSWGGCWVRLAYTIDNGANWHRFYDSGYSGAMVNDGTIVHPFHDSVKIDFDEVKNAEQIKVRLIGKSYNSSSLCRLNYTNGVDSSLLDRDNLGLSRLRIKESGTIYGDNPSFSALTMQKVTFNGATVNAGKSENYQFANGSNYFYSIDLPAGEMIDTVTATNNKVTVIDNHRGFIEVAIADGEGDITVDIATKEIPSPYYLQINPENIGNTLSAYAGGRALWIGGACLGGFRNYEKFAYIGAGSPYNTPCGIGIDGYALFNRKASITKLSDNGWYINKRSFIITGWAKAIDNEGDDASMYIFGNTNTGSTNKALHIGWRNNTTFTVAFYGNDIDITVPNGYKIQEITNKWVHIAVWHDTVSRVSKVYLDGQYIGEGTHTGGQYDNHFNVVMGSRNVSNTTGFISNMRLYRTEQDQSFTNVSDQTFMNIYNNEKLYLIDYSDS